MIYDYFFIKTRWSTEVKSISPLGSPLHLWIYHSWSQRYNYNDSKSGIFKRYNMNKSRCLIQGNFQGHE